MESHKSPKPGISFFNPFVFNDLIIKKGRWDGKNKFSILEKRENIGDISNYSK
jgi:hypothetical protein